MFAARAGIRWRLLILERVPQCKSECYGVDIVLIIVGRGPPDTFDFIGIFGDIPTNPAPPT